MWTWLSNLLTSIFGLGIDKAIEHVEEDRLRAKASEAEAAKEQLASAARADSESEDLARVAAKVRPIKNRSQLDGFVRDYNGKGQ